MGIACKWNWHNTGRQVWYDKSTFETLKATYPLYFYDDFVGSAGGSVFDGTTIWDVVDVNDASAAIVANSSNGQFLLHIHTTDEAEDAVLYQYNTALTDDNLTFDVGNGLIFETRINMAVAPGTGVRGVAGMAGPHNLDKDTIANAAWFSWAASQVCRVETDDTTNNLDEATGVTTVAGTYNIFRIDFTTLADVKFFIDGVRVGAATTFDMSNLTAGEQQMQPYFSMDKAGGLAALGDMNIDYVKIWSNRS
jgi:hypothetical protein